MTPRQRLAKGREGVLDHMPYLASYVYALRPVECAGKETMGVTRDGVLMWNPAFVMSLDLLHLTYVLLHEALHLILRHWARAEEVYGDAPTVIQQYAMNLAGDLVIEQTMSSMRSARPPGAIYLGCTEPRFGMRLDFRPNLDMTEYYRLIMARLTATPDGGGARDKAGDPSEGDEPSGGRQQATPQATSPQGQAGQPRSGGSDRSASALCSPGSGGSASDGVPRPWEVPDETWAAFQEVIAASTAEQAIRQANLLNPGSVPGNLIETIVQFLRPQPNPFDHLRSAVASSVAAPVGGRGATYRRPSRKQPDDACLLRGYETTQAHAVVIVDTSGSMHDKETKERALQVISDGLRKLKGVRVFCADTRIRSSATLQSATNFRWVGGGGTDMASVIEQVDRESRPDSIVVVTDAATRWPARQTRARVIVALTAASTYRRSIPSWMKVVPLFKEHA